MTDEQSLCEWVITEYGDDLRQMLDDTAERRIEYGFKAIGFPDDVERTAIVSGDEDTVDITSQTTDAFRPVRVGVHTHPWRSVSFSEKDLWHTINQYLLHGNQSLPEGWRRGLVTVAVDNKDTDRMVVRAYEVTDAIEGSDPSEQMDVANEILAAKNDVGWGFASPAQRDEITGRYIDICTITAQR